MQHRTVSNFLYVFFLFLSFCAIIACGSGARLSNGSFNVPPGIDSIVAKEADSLKGFFFVTPKTEKEIEKLKRKAHKRLRRSDSLWIKVQDIIKVSTADSISSSLQIKDGTSSLKKIAALTAKIGKNAAVRDDLQKIPRLLDEAIVSFEKAIRLNPFDTKLRRTLARVYALKAERLEDNSQFKNAAQTLENVLKLDKSDHSVYHKLAVNYFKMGYWQPALETFSMAEDVLRKTAFLHVSNPDSLKNNIAPVDSLNLFIYKYYQGLTLQRLYNAPEALKVLAAAKLVAQIPDRKELIDIEVAWINWDAGNIRASEIRDSLLTLQKEEKYEDAVKGFLRLSSFARTQHARDEARWRAAVLQYQQLGEKKEAIARLQELIQHAKDSTGLPVDSTYQKYFEDYATMCFNLGLEYSKDKDWQKAFTYFLQASKLQWKGQAKSHIGIAKIVQNNPALVIQHCLKAKTQENSLAPLEREQLYQLLSVAYLKKGETGSAKDARLNWLNLRKEKKAHVAKNGSI